MAGADGAAGAAGALFSHTAQTDVSFGCL